ncbi:hypothetical protein BCR41DRAFT_346792 [Lobosporangium transversale]|uniref:Uncharacterized protein n=1 Tax=Lobosporangium transversale TaxID=64571 RepID=A0A1Y2GYT5_9FUNG|nr:hypothetical protein BCR41DRAFT_346792 [Lobosporangium transversale]ORZ27447.1 hypothetical protein BCR41DRAFT_346792 [Lobosporangium transversale]|eukprot:XP_021885174.1 hypothetical protein BCR41DRAFT_346792 [Lobosporangium transversale]
MMAMLSAWVWQTLFPRMMTPLFIAFSLGLLRYILYLRVKTPFKNMESHLQQPQCHSSMVKDNQLEDQDQDHWQDLLLRKSTGPFVAAVAALHQIIQATRMTGTKRV